MKVIILTSHISTGGIGVYTVNLAKQLSLKNFDVRVLSSGGDLEKLLASVKIEHVAVDIKTKSEFGLKVLKAVPRIARYVRENGIDLIHAQTRVAQVLAFMVWKNTGIPFISTCHGFFRHKKLGRRILPCWGRKVIAISKGVEDHLINDFRVKASRVAQIYNGIDVERFAKKNNGNKNAFLAERMGIDPADKIIGTVGRISSVKGQEYLICAFEELMADHPCSRLLIVGNDGGYKSRLECMAEEKGLSDHIIFDVGDKAPLDEYYSLIDVFCLPSIQEGLGLALLEAMASGKPCIASNVGGIPEIIENNVDGILVPPSDAGSLSEAIKKLMDNEKLMAEYGRKGREKIVGKFSLEESVSKTIEVYKEVVDSRE